MLTIVCIRGGKIVMACKHCDHCEIEHHEHHEHKEKENKLDIILYIIAIVFLGLSFIPTFTNTRVIFILLSIILSGYELLCQGG